VVARRAEIYWADLGPPADRRPVCVLTRDAAIAVLTTVTCAPITRTARGIRSEIEVGSEQGLPEPSVINCDNLVTVRRSALDPDPVGRLDQVKWAELDRALRYTLDIRY
jgi:mRNA interferase MazF